MDDNFDPGERFAATQGLRGAYDGDAFGVAGGNMGDTSWVPDGYGYVADKDRNYGIDGLFKGLSSEFLMNGKEADLPRQAIDFDKWLPGELNFDRTFQGYNTGDSALDKTGQIEALRNDITKTFGEGGITRQRAYNRENPLKWYDRYVGEDGKVFGDRYGETSNDFLDKYSLPIGKMLLGAGMGYGLGAMFAPAAGMGSGVGGSGLVAGASGGGTGAGLSAGAATGGTGAGLGSGAFAGFGGASPGLLGGMGGMLGKAAGRAGVNTLLNGGDMGDFGSSFASNMIPAINVSGFGDYDDLLTKSLRGAASGYLTGGGQGALLGAASPGINQGMNKLGDYFSNAFSGTDWEQDSFGSGNYSMGAPQGGLQGVFAQNGISSGAPQGPMSTNSQMQLGAGSGNQIDWDAVLQGQQGFGNVNPQEQQGPDQQAMGYQPSAFGVGMDTAMPDPMQMANAPTAAPAQGYDEYVKQMPDALKAVLVARYPQLRGVLGGGARMSPVAAGAGALATLYTANRANKDLKKQQGQLDSLFGQNSAYSKTLREQLARKDAASGRRSQYGPREVELQARLAQLNGQLAPQRFALSQAQDQNRMGMYGSLINYADQSGLTDRLSKGLSDYFKG